jgi:tetratricopeptide (TPR) repeat protein
MVNNFKFFLFVLLFTVNAVSFQISSKDSVFSQNVTDLILQCQFDSANNLIDTYRKTDSKNPLPPVLKLAALGMRDVDLEMTVDSLLFMNTYALAIANVLDYEKTNGKNDYSRMLIGFTNAIHSSFYLRRKKYMSAMQNGIDAMKVLREAKEIDSTNTEVDFFLGLYDYAKAELRSRLWWVMFWYPGGKKEGIAKLENCTKTAFIVGNAALITLSNIYTDEKKPEKAIRIIQHLDSLYPSSRFVSWAKVKYFEKLKMYTNAAEEYNKLSLQYSSVKNGQYNSFLTKKKEALMYYEAGQKGKVQIICEAMLSDPLLTNEDIRKETKRLLEKVNES